MYRTAKLFQRRSASILELALVALLLGSALTMYTSGERVTGVLGDMVANLRAS